METYNILLGEWTLAQLVFFELMDWISDSENIWDRAGNVSSFRLNPYIFLVGYRREPICL
jgi:hypothetical protein